MDVVIENKLFLYLFLGLLFLVCFLHGFIAKKTKSNQIAHLIIVGSLALFVVIGLPLLSRPTHYYDLSHLREGTVTQVFDGDTLEIYLSGGFKKATLGGINAPKIGHGEQKLKDYAPIVKDYTTKELKGRTVWISMDTDEPNRYGELVVYLWLAKPTGERKEEMKQKMFNVNLLRKGYGRIMGIEESRYKDFFIEIQEEAKKAKRGIWSGGK